MTKIGTGIQVLGGINTYTGATTINAGTLSVTGSLDINGSVSINTGGTLSGAGDGGFTGLVGNVTMAAGGSISTGESSALGSIGTLTMSSLTVNGGDLKFNLVNPAGSDLIRVNGAANFTAASTITPNGGMAGTYTVLTSTSPITYAATPTLTPFVDPLTRPATYALDTTSTPTELKLTVTGGSKASLGRALPAMGIGTLIQRPTGPTAPSPKSSLTTTRSSSAMVRPIAPFRSLGRSCPAHWKSTTVRATTTRSPAPAASAARSAFLRTVSES